MTEQKNGPDTGFYERFYRKWWFALLLNLAVMAVLLLVCRPKFETNDDMGIAFFINRARPIQDTYLLFENRILGIVMAKLYSITNMLPWYGLLQIAGLLTGFTAMTYVFLNHFEGWSGLLLSGGLLSLFAYEGYILMQFTKTGGLITACGILLVFYAMTGPRMRWLSAIIETAITGWGFLYREEQPLLVTALMCVYGLFLLMNLAGMSDKRQVRRLLVRYFGCLAAVALTGGGIWFFHDYTFHKNQESMDYRLYNNAHSVLSDYGFPSYEKHREEMEALGLDEATYNYYKSWNYYDPELVTTELFEKLAQMKAKDRGSFGADTIRRFLKRYPSDFFENRSFYMWLAALAVLLLFGFRRWQTPAAAVIQIVLLLSLFLYLFYQGRYGYNRVDCPVWFSCTLVLLMMTDPEKLRLPWRFAVLMIAGCLIFNQHFWSVNWRSSAAEKEAKRKETEQLTIQLSQDQDHLYLLRMGGLEFADAFGPLDLVPVGVYSNTAPLGGWGAGSPSYKAVLNRFGVVNPFRDVINHPEVYLIDNQIEQTMEYIHSHYDPHAIATRAGEIGKYPYYTVTSEY